MRATAVNLDSFVNLSGFVLRWAGFMDVREIMIPSSKGGISASIHSSEKQSDRLAILCPGYLDSKDYGHLVKLAEELAEHGYTAVRFDPTGTWASAGDIADYNVTRYLEDIEDVVGFMFKEHGYKTILLGGHSLGGSVSILHAARDPRTSQVLGIMPSAERVSHDQQRKEWEESGVRISQRELVDGKGTRTFEVPFSYMEDRENYSVLEDVKKTRASIDLVAGELDDVVLPEEVQEIYEAANEPKKFVVLAGIDHDYRHNDMEIKTVNDKLLELLAA